MFFAIISAMLEGRTLICCLGSGLFQGDELAKLKRALYQAVRRLMFHEEGPFECKDTS